MTIKPEKKKRKGGCCRNCCRMWNYRKVVTQQEQYDFNMRVIEDWKRNRKTITTTSSNDKSQFS